MSDMKHELIQTLRDLALELGRTPTRSEFNSKVKGGSYRMTKAFGTFAVLLAAAGLDSYDERRTAKKIDSSIFNKSLESHLDKYEVSATNPPVIRLPYATIATISDIHWPFEKQSVIDKFYEYVGDTKPELTILNGDAWDMYSHTRFPRSHNIFTPREEDAMSRSKNEAFWLEIKRRAPATRCIQMLGNHDIRPLKRVLEAYPSAEDWIQQAIEKAFTFPGVETIFDPREELVVGDVLVFHGYRSQLGAHRDYTMYNTVNGHTHRGGTVFRHIRGQTLWELNSGFAGDPLAKGLTYTPQKITEWTNGFGAVDKLGPRFIPE